MYYIPEPPYFLLLAGLLAGITSGAAFSATLKQFVKEWSKNRSTRTLANFKSTQIGLPFLGIGVGVCVFLASGLEIFSFPKWFAYGVSVLLTIFTSALIWYQLGKVLNQLERGGSQALDLDS